MPKWTGNLGLDYQLPADSLGFSGNFIAGVGYQYVGSRFAEEMKPYHMINSRIGWENERVGVYGFANNLLDERPLAYSVSFGPDARGVYIGRGRVLGVGTSINTSNKQLCGFPRLPIAP